VDSDDDAAGGGAGDTEAAALRIDPEVAAGARVRIRLDWRTFAYLVIAILAALALIAVLRSTTTMLTRIGIGLVIALALDPLTRSLQRRFELRRGTAVALVAAGVAALAALLIGVLGPRAVAEARQFSDQLPETLDDVESLPLVGGIIRDNEVAEKAQDWLRRLPEQFTDERVSELAGRLVSGVASVAMAAIIASSFVHSRRANHQTNAAVASVKRYAGSRAAVSVGPSTSIAAASAAK
jgi:predicted PurR-regulated permease PerM